MLIYEYHALFQRSWKQDQKKPNTIPITCFELKWSVSNVTLVTAQLAFPCNCSQCREMQCVLLTWSDLRFALSALTACCFPTATQFPLKNKMCGCCCSRSLSLGYSYMVKFSEGCVNWTVFLKSLILIKKLVLWWWKEVRVAAHFLLVLFPSLCVLLSFKVAKTSGRTGWKNFFLLICQSDTIWLLSSLHFSGFVPVPLDFFMLVMSLQQNLYTKEKWDDVQPLPDEVNDSKTTDQDPEFEQEDTNKSSTDLMALVKVRFVVFFFSQPLLLGWSCFK